MSTPPTEQHAENRAPEGRAGASGRRTWRLAAVAGIVLGAIAAGVAAGVIHQRGVEAERRRSREIRELIRDGRGDEARARLERWLESAPDDAEAHYLRARVELADDRPKQVIAELTRAAELGYPRPEVDTLGAVLQARAGHFEAAEPVLVEALGRSKEPEPEVAQALARIYLSTFRLPQAAAAIDRWMRDAPRDARPYLWRNEIDSRRDAGHAVLIRNYREALRRDPELAEARLGLADQLRESMRLDEAAREYAAYIRRRPDDPEGHLGAGQAAASGGDFETAIRHLDRALDLDPRDPIALKERAAIDLRRADYRSARGRLETLLEIDPYDPEAHHSLSQVLNILGEDDRARSEAETSRRLRKEHQHMDEIRSALVKDPSNVELRYEAARWLLDHARTDEGLRWAHEALRLRPEHAPTHRLLADYYERTGDPGKANYHRLQSGPE